MFRVLHGAALTLHSFALQHRWHGSVGAVVTAATETGLNTQEAPVGSSWQAAG